MSRIALGRTFAKFHVSDADPNYKGQIMLPLDSIVSISTFSAIKGNSIIYFKCAFKDKEIEHVIVEDSIDDIYHYLRAIE